MEPSALTSLIFYISLTTGLLIFFSVLLSIFFPSRRIWPPPQKASWQYWLTWIFYTIYIIGSLSLGWLDWDSGVSDHWLRYPVGALLIVGGLAFASWGIRTLGWHRTSGLKGSFVLAGPYKLSRNPQYVGDSLALLGYALFTNSTLVLIINIIGIVGMLLTPFSEEPWLRERFGEEYEDYLKKVPRYFSLGLSKRS